MARTSTFLNFLFRKNTAKLLLLLLFTCVAGFAQAQSVTLFDETVGNNPTRTVTEYQQRQWFDHNKSNNPPVLTFSGTATVEVQSPSTYTNASKRNYIRAIGGQYLMISEINSLEYTGLALSFGVYRDSPIALKVEYSVDGSTWTQLSIGTPTANTWSYIAGITDDVNGNKMPQVENLRLRFSASGPLGELRLDDIKLTGVYNSVLPVITGFTPAEGGKGTVVTINGRNLQNAQFVYFTATNTLHEILEVTADYIRIRITGGADSQLGIYTVDGKIAASTDVFNYIEPIVTSFRNQRGETITSTIEGETITLIGENLASTHTVVFENGISATPISTTSTSVTVIVPAGALTGRVEVQTSMYGEGYSTELLTVFRPEIFSLSPTSGKISTVVTITGARLNIGTYKVYFSGSTTPVEATVTSAKADGTELVVTVPAGAVTGPITVRTSEGTAISPTFTVLQASMTIRNTPLATFGTKKNIPSASQYYTVSGVNLNGGITVTAPTHFQVSKDNITWTNQLFYAIDANSAVPESRVYVRYLPSANGTHTGNITNTSGSITQLVAVRGTTLDPVIVVNASLTAFSAQVGTPSASQTYTVSGTNMESSITVVAPAEFEVSLDNIRFTPTVIVPLPPGSTKKDPTPVYVRYNPATAGSHSGNIVHSSLNATNVLLAVNGSSVTPLPVELLSFKATVQGNKAQLTWATASETDNSHFEIETSLNAVNSFEQVGRVDSKTTNSSTLTSYAFAHNLGSASGTRYYRLKQVDLDGTSAYSKVVAVTVKTQELALQVLVAPNPLNYNSKAFITVDESGKAALTLHDMTGKRMYQKSVEVKEGQNEIQLPLYDQLKNGVYILTVEVNGKHRQVKVVKQ